VFTTLEEKVAPGHTALIVIDMQNDFVDDEGACAQNGQDMTPVQAIVPTLKQFAASAREAGALVVYVRVSHDDSTNSEAYLERRKGRSADVCTEGTWGAEWYPELVPEAGDVTVTKHRFSAFIDTSLDLILRSRGIRTIITTGTATNVCVESTARHGHMLDYYVIFPEDASASTDLPAHDATLHNIQKHFGDVVKAADIEAAWAKVATRA
jgi:ureidoacrylate peracid hydrolase